VVLLLVGSGDEIGAAFEGLVEDDEGSWLLWMRRGFEADGAEIACRGLEGGFDLFGDHRTEFTAGDGEKLRFVEGVVASQEDYDGAEFAQFGVVRFREFRHVGHGFDLVDGRYLEKGTDLVDGALAGRVDELGMALAAWGQIFNGS
jgi:hypothetical protein